MGRCGGALVSWQRVQRQQRHSQGVDERHDRDCDRLCDRRHGDRRLTRFAATSASLRAAYAARQAGLRVYYRTNCGLQDELRIREFPWAAPSPKRLPTSMQYTKALRVA